MYVNSKNCTKIPFIWYNLFGLSLKLNAKVYCFEILYYETKPKKAAPQFSKMLNYEAKKFKQKKIDLDLYLKKNQNYQFRHNYLIINYNTNLKILILLLFFKYIYFTLYSIFNKQRNSN